MHPRLLYRLTLVYALLFAIPGCGDGKEAYDGSGSGGDGNDSQQRESTDLEKWLRGEGPYALDQVQSTSSGDTQAPAENQVTWQQVREGAVTRTNPHTGVTWTILGIRTDEGERSRALQNAENALSNHPDIAGMVGLWAYNPPAILQAVEARDMLDQVTIVGFDEDVRTLDAIGQGKIVGTVVQNPYGFGFRSVEYLSATIRGEEVTVPEDRLLYVPTYVINPDNVAEFSSIVRQIRAGNGPQFAYDADRYDTSEEVSMHFVTNVADPFWELAKEGCELGADAFNARVTFFVPPNGQVAEQLQHVETMIVNGVDGLAISVRSPEGQVGMINQWCKELTVITVDSDAVESDRLFYLGTNNVAAGRQAGELLAEANPEGGKVMIFVGALDQANAYQRSQGVIDALFGQ